jgi:hypothetical protein
MVLNTELGRLWIEVVMALSWQQPGGTEENTERPQSYLSFKPVTIQIEVRSLMV